MVELPSAILNVVESFAKLPGVGAKTAQRQVMAMTKWNHAELQQFATAVSELQTLKFCKECGMFSEGDICNICATDSRSSAKVLCVVENINDLMAIEKSNTFTGVYHILGGVLNPLSGIGPDQLKIDKLVERVKKLGVETVILAVNPSVEGDATCSYIKQLLGDVNIERIGFGIPIGGSLEYLDPLTISKALENRKML
jgi:recombination protein RecR